MLLSGAALAAPAGAYFRVDHAFVPGIGRVGTVFPSDAKVHRPGRVPHATYTTEREINNAMNREAKVERRVHPTADSGDPDEVRLIKRQVAHELFLRKVVRTCLPRSKAALWIYWYLHAPRNRRPYVNELETNRRAFKNARHRCFRARLRVDRWQGVRIDRTEPTHARAMLRGAYEFKTHRHWRGSPTTWKLSLHFLNGRWRIAVDSETYPGSNTSGD